MRRLSKTQKSSDLKISVFWGDVLYDTAICKPNSAITIGKNPDNSFIVELPGELESASQKDSFKLVEVVNDSAELFFNPNLEGHLRFGKEVVSLAAAKQSKQVFVEPNGTCRAKLSLGDRADVVIGHVSFNFDWIQKSDNHEVLKSRFMDRRQTALLLLSGLFCLLLFGLFQLAPPVEMEKPPERLVTIVPPNAPAKASIGSYKTADGGAQSGPIGKAELHHDEKPSMASQISKANLGNLVNGLTSLAKSAPTMKTTPNSVAAAIEQTGTGGFSTTGLAKGGGGKSVGIGRTVGQGQGGFEGTGHLGLAGDSMLEGGTGRGAGEVVQRGGLDRDVIDVIIRRRQDRIRLCYERQLNFNPKLSGKVAIHFVIGKDGTVLESRLLEDTMKNASVNKCILNEVRSWTFPKPQGGLSQPVDYPFVFESSTHGAT
jgi:hypothetical protein